MQDILQTIIENLVDNREAVSIEKIEEDYKEIYKVKVAPEEMGKVIGKQGKIAGAIRTILKSLGAKEHKKIDVEFVD